MVRTAGSAAVFQPVFFGFEGFGMLQYRLIVIVRAAGAVLTLPQKIKNADFAVAQFGRASGQGQNAAEVVNAGKIAVNAYNGALVFAYFARGSHQQRDEQCGNDRRCAHPQRQRISFFVLFLRLHLWPLALTPGIWYF